jgi:hypothetical protein
VKAHRSPKTHRACACAVVVIAALAVGHMSVAGATSTSPAQYAKAVCSAVATVHTNTTAAEASLGTAEQTYQDQTTPENATQLRQALVTYLQQVRGFFRDELTAFHKAGHPAGKNGAAFARTLDKNLETAANALDPVIQKAGAIEVDTPTAFSNGVQEVFTQLTKASNASKKQARQAAAFKDVPTELQPIVAYAKGHGDTCSAA